MCKSVLRIGKRVQPVTKDALPHSRGSGHMLLIKPDESCLNSFAVSSPLKARSVPLFIL